MWCVVPVEAEGGWAFRGQGPNGRLKYETLVCLPMTSLAKNFGNFEDFLPFTNGDGGAASFRRHVESAALPCPAMTMAELLERHTLVGGSSELLAKNAEEELISDAEMPTLTQYPGGVRMKSLRCAGVTTSPGKTEDQRRKEAKIRAEDPRFKQIQDIIKKIEAMRTAPLLLGGFSEGWVERVEPYTRKTSPDGPKSAAKAGPSTKTAKKKRAANHVDPVLTALQKNIGKKLKADNKEYNTEVTATAVAKVRQDMEAKLAAANAENAVLRRELKEAEGQAQANKEAALIADSKLSNAKALHAESIKAATATARLHMLLSERRLSTSGSHNSADRSDSPATWEDRVFVDRGL